MENTARILVLDDDVSWQEMYKEALTETGYIVETVGTLASALDALQRRFFHVAVVDLKLGSEESNRDGLQALRHIWMLGEGTLAIIGSGYADPGMYDEFQKMGIFGLTEIPAEARRELQKIDFYKGHIRKDEPLGSILEKVNRAVNEALPKYIQLRGSTSPFGILKGLSAREIQLALRVGPLTELRPFLSSMVLPLFPWLASKQEFITVKDDKGEVLVFETLCWSRALGKAVVLRFGRRNGFQLSSDMLPIGSSFQEGKAGEMLTHISSDHFEGEVFGFLTDFDQHFYPPPVKNSMNNTLHSS